MLFLLLFFFLFKQPIFAQNTQLFPLSYQFSFVYQALPASLFSFQQTPATSSSEVLGTTTNLQNPNSTPAIGGEGQVLSVAILGDSMIDTLGTNLSSLQKNLTLYYPKAKFLLYNYGYGSSTLRDTINRLGTSYAYNNKKYENLFDLVPDIVVLESHAYNNYGNTTSGYDRHWQELSEAIGILKKNLPTTRTILATTLTPNSILFDKENNLSTIDKIERTKTITNYLNRTISYAKSQNLPLADSTTPSLNNNDGISLYINSKDGIHPSAQGADLFSSTLAQAIQSLNIIDTY